MKSSNMTKRIWWGIASIGLLGISYWLCRFTFFELHGMKSWPNTLALVALIIIIVASISGGKIISIATAIGYMAGFVFAMIFYTEGIDPGGGSTNNIWLLWGIAFIVFSLMGLALDIVLNKKKQIFEGVR